VPEFHGFGENFGSTFSPNLPKQGTWLEGGLQSLIDRRFAPDCQPWIECRTNAGMTGGVIRRTDPGNGDALG